MGRFYGILITLGFAITWFLVLATSGGADSDARPVASAYQPRSAQSNAPAEPGRRASVLPPDALEDILPPADYARAKTIRLAIDTEPATLDPIAITDTISDGVGRKVYSMLVRLDYLGDTFEVVPDVAERFSISPDGKVYVFTLRKGVRFHNGREVKAADVVYSLMRLLKPESKRPDWLMPFVEGSKEFYQNGTTPVGIRAEGDYVVIIRLAQAFAPFIHHLCTVNCAIVPREEVERKDRPFARNPVGVGPFSLEHWRDNEVLALRRHDDYFKGRPRLSGVKFFIMREPLTRLQNYFAGELDATTIPYDHTQSAIERAGEKSVLRRDTLRTNYIGIGFPNGEFTEQSELRPFGTNKTLRQAIAYAIDREYLCDKVLEGRGIPACGILPPGMPGFKPGRDGWPRDLNKAKALLAEAGHPDGAGLPELKILHRNDPDTLKVAQVIADDLEKIGLNVRLQARDWNSLLKETETAPRQMFLLGWVADYPDPDNFLYLLFHSSTWGSMGNHTWYHDPEIDRLTEQARNLVEMKDRAPLYEKIEDKLLKDSPWICTYHVRNIVLLNPKVKGIRRAVTPLDTGTEFPQVDFAFVDIMD